MTRHEEACARLVELIDLQTERCASQDADRCSHKITSVLNRNRNWWIFGDGVGVRSRRPIAMIPQEAADIMSREGAALEQDTAINDTELLLSAARELLTAIDGNTIAALRRAVDRFPA